MAAKANPNMKVWDAVEQTPIKHTKKVNVGRGFTAIDAQYCIMRATEVFGPVGEGWGWTADTNIVPEFNFVSSEVTVWHGSPANSYGPFTSIIQLKNKNGALDTDAPKKCTTDALTKCLSHLGIGADIFLGKYDDNKYIAELRAKESEKIKNQFSVADHPDPDEEAAERAAERVVRETIAGDL